MQIELHPGIAKNLLDYLLNAKKRAEFVIAKKNKYDQAAVKRAEHVVSLLTPVCESLSKAVHQPGFEPTKPEEQGRSSLDLPAHIEDIEKRFNDLTNRVNLLTRQLDQLLAWKDQTNVILRKLVAYHEGEIK